MRSRPLGAAAIGDTPTACLCSLVWWIGDPFEPKFATLADLQAKNSIYPHLDGFWVQSSWAKYNNPCFILGPGPTNPFYPSTKPRPVKPWGPWRSSLYIARPENCRQVALPGAYPTLFESIDDWWCFQRSIRRFPLGQIRHQRLHACRDKIGDLQSWLHPRRPLPGFIISTELELTMTYMGVSENNGTSKSSILNRVFHYKPSILRYPYFWKNPYKKVLWLFQAFGWNSSFTDLLVRLKVTATCWVICA